MKLCRIKIKRFTLTPMGAVIGTSGCRVSPARKIFVLCAGILANLICAAGTALSIRLIPDYYLSCGTKGILSYSVFSNISLAVLNFLPVKELDGGMILEEILSKYVLPDTQDRIIRTTSFIFLMILWLISMYAFIKTGYNFTLFAVTVYLFAKTFVCGRK